MRVVSVLFLILGASCMGSDTPCTGLNKKDCLAIDACTAEVGSSACSGDMCTDDMVFQGCRSATSKEIFHRKNMRKKQVNVKRNCVASKGQWVKYERKRYGKCRCPGNTFFVVGKGCRTLGKVCAEEGGTFYPVNTFECSDEWREKYPFYCPRELSYRSDNFRKPKYTHSDRELCLCKNQRPWVRGKGCL